MTKGLQVEGSKEGMMKAVIQFHWRRRRRRRTERARCQFGEKKEGAKWGLISVCDMCKIWSVVEGGLAVEQEEEDSPTAANYSTLWLWLAAAAAGTACTPQWSRRHQQMWQRRLRLPRLSLKPRLAPGNCIWGLPGKIGDIFVGHIFVEGQ